MSLGISLHIGVVDLDASQYPGPPVKLPSAEKDAASMALIAASVGFYAKRLISSDATASHVLAEIERSAKTLRDGDIFFLSYSGHGFRVSASLADGDLDDSWALYDRLVLASELRVVLSKFEAGVRLLVTSDSCDSGAIITPEMLEKVDEFGRQKHEHAVVETIPVEAKHQVLEGNRGFYDSRRSHSREANIQASILLLAASKPDEAAVAIPAHGLFTEALLEAWQNGGFIGDYYRFYLKIKDCGCLKQKLSSGAVVSVQTPVYRFVGMSNYEFEGQRPFTI